MNGARSPEQEGRGGQAIISAPTTAHRDATEQMKRPKETRPERTDLSTDESRFLAALAERIRTLRAQRGMTRKILARDTGVSERYLAELEAGHGNISIIRLRQIALAMGLPLEQLVQVEADPSPELTLLVQYLGRLSTSNLAHARSLLMAEFENRARRDRVALIGLRGAGKTTLGTLLARKRNVPFIELTKEIEHDAGTSISEIFSLYGQAAYRRYERRALQSTIDSYERFVLVPGGSIVSEPATFDVLLTSCQTIWIKASPEEHMARVVAQGDRRPMIDNHEAMRDLQRILAGRESMYSKADAVVDTSGCTIEESFARLEAGLQG